MSNAGDRLARTRLALIEQAQRRERRHEGRDGEREYAHAGADENDGGGTRPHGAGWFGSIKHVVGTWWRHHPAHMGIELVTPLLSTYARRKPAQFLGIAALVGAVVVVARPWRLISATGLLIAVLKSSQLSGVLLSAMAAADFRKDPPPYE
ncbi:MAG: hypothetical protein JWQ07_4837 [Ramlibacter sp.]|nr:hypothetical protein [Ramlibacter sp.]